ncbi:nucleotide kinase [Escherichia virus LS2]|uniref:Nucleotide kinase n=1 Tax=Escherichia virus LS2 TaxID=2743776 RepID=A0ACD4QLB5_9CAUD
MGRVSYHHRLSSLYWCRPLPLLTTASKLVGNKIDAVRKPSHYQVFDGVESIEIIARSMTVSEFRGFCMGNVLKYRLRAGKKSELATMEKDLNKAAFYQELFDLHKGKCYAAERLVPERVTLNPDYALPIHIP